MFYIGTCRYMHGYPWTYFPARLHSTREIIYFLENITNIKQIIDDNPSDLTNSIFGDIYEPCVKVFSLNFMNTKIDRNITKIIMEISSRKVRYYNNIPLSHYYSQWNTNTEYNLIEKILTDEEIDLDLCYIIKLCKEIFNENIEIHVIPHLNLKTKLSSYYIFERNNFVILLECLCNKYKIKMHNIGKYIESINNTDNSFLELHMPDSTHYDPNTREIIRKFLFHKIIDNPS